MRCEAAFYPRRVRLGAHERCHGCHLVRVGQNYRESHVRPMIVDTRYLQYRVRHSSLPYLVSHWTTYCLDRNPFRYTSSPLSRLSALRCNSSGCWWSHSSSQSELHHYPGPSPQFSPISHGAEHDKNIFAKDARAFETNVSPRCYLAAKRIRWNGPFLLMPQVHLTTIMASNRRCTTNLAAAGNLGTANVDTNGPQERPCLGERKYLVAQANQRGRLTWIFEFCRLLPCHWSGLAHFVQLGRSWVGIGLSTDSLLTHAKCSQGPAPRRLPSALWHLRPAI